MLTEIDSILASPAALPGFWIFMYRISPFTYLIGAFLSTGLANYEVRCSSLELATFNPPSGQTCGEYIEAFVKMTGGAIYNPNAVQDCKYCPMSTTNIFLASVYSFYDERWRNFGLMWVYIVFNAFRRCSFVLAIACTTQEFFKEGSRRFVPRSVSGKEYLDELKRVFNIIITHRFYIAIIAFSRIIKFVLSSL
jgi:hypothetical protein